MDAPDRTMLLLKEIRDELKTMNARMMFEFSEINERIRRLDQRVEGCVTRIDAIERK